MASCFSLPRRHVSPSRRRIAKGGDKELAIVVLHISASLGAQAISLELDVIKQVNRAPAKSGSEPSSRKVPIIIDVALGVHFLRGKQFEGIARSEIETEIAHCDTNVIQICTLPAKVTEEVVPDFGRRV